MTLQEWEAFKDKCFISYSGNSFFAELKSLDIITERLNVVDRLKEYAGVYVSHDQIKKILKLDEDNSDSVKDMNSDNSDDEFNDDDDDDESDENIEDENNF